MISSSTEPTWYRIAEEAAVPSPALLVYPERVEHNLRQMLAIAGGPDHLRPHIKTHKMPEVIGRQLQLGIEKFKCATVAEAEMAAMAGVRDLLLAYQPVGPAIQRLCELRRRFPATHFSVVADTPEIVRELSRALQESGSAPGHSPTWSAPLEVLLDLDIGQHRTGLPPGPRALDLYRLIAALPELKPGGLHAYDGHLSEPDAAQRAGACEQAFAPVAALREELKRAGFPVPRVVASGTPTFAFHARRGDVECSPGTCVFWDAGYAKKLPELNFIPAALVLTRVISKPGEGRLCLDLGHKALGSEMPHPRVVFLNLPDGQALSHSEEHLVIQTARDAEFQVGDCLYGIPWHVCPTVALHSEAQVVQNGRTVGVWKVTARERRLSI